MKSNVNTEDVWALDGFTGTVAVDPGHIMVELHGRPSSLDGLGCMRSIVAQSMEIRPAPASSAELLQAAVAVSPSRRAAVNNTIPASAFLLAISYGGRDRSWCRPTKRSPENLSTPRPEAPLGRSR
jgi:hypothetical protein